MRDRSSSVRGHVRPKVREVGRRHGKNGMQQARFFENVVHPLHDALDFGRFQPRLSALSKVVQTFSGMQLHDRSEIDQIWIELSCSRQCFRELSVYCRMKQLCVSVRLRGRR